MEIIVTHDMADFDALAAAVAAQKLHPEAVIVLGRRVGREVRDYLALHKDRFVTRSLEDVDLEQVEHLIVVDVRRQSRLRELARLLERVHAREVRVSVYDHHPASDDDLPADFERVEPVGSATTLLVEEMDQRGIRLDEQEATLLALGVHADTGSLTYAGSTARDARALARLFDQGASPVMMSRYLSLPFSAAQRALLAELLGTLTLERVGHLGVGFVVKDLPRAVNGFAEVVTELAELSGAAAVFAVFGIGKNRTAIVARSRSPLVDAGAHVTALGGGGHPGAASAMLKRGDSHAVFEELRASVRAQPPRARRVAELMSSPVHTLASSLPFAEAARSLATWRHTGAPVMKDGALVGIVSRSDVERAERDGRLDLPVSSSMSQRVHSVDADEPPERALGLMQEHDIGRLPVLRDGRLVGIVTRSDLRRMLYGEDSRPKPA